MKALITLSLVLMVLRAGLPGGVSAVAAAPARPVAPFEAGVPACLAWVVADTTERERVERTYDVVIGLESGSLLLRSEADVELVARFMAAGLDRDNNEHLRSQYAEYLARYPHPAAADALVRAVQRDSRFDVTPSALQALATLGDPRGRDLLVERLATGRDLSQPFEHGLGQLIATYGDSTYLAPLAALAVDERAPASRRAGARAALDALTRRLATHFVDPFGLPDALAAQMRAQQVVAIPADKNEMFELYGRELPFVTSDVVYHTWMILLRAALDDLEKLVMEPRLTDWSTRLARAALRRARTTPVAERESARALAARLAVPARLLGGLAAREVNLPADWQRRVTSEIELIEAARGPARSPLRGREEDYGAYRPRGRVAAVAARRGYAQALAWYERDGFRVASAADCRQGVALLDLLRSDPALLAGWHEFETRLERLFGPADDLTVRDYLAALDRVAPPRASAGHGAGRAAHAAGVLRSADIARLQEELRRAAAPQLDPRVGPPAPDSLAWPEATRGLRLFGGRRTRAVVEVQRQMEAGAWPPRGACLLPALFPGAEAAALCPDSLVRPHETARPPSPIAEPTDPYGNVSDGARHALAPLFDETDPRRPAFMRGQSWRCKQANAALGAWVETQHATAAYNKDANTYLSAEFARDRFQGYVEPVPAFYARMDTLVLRLRAWCATDSLFQLSAADTTVHLTTPPRGSVFPGRESARDHAAFDPMEDELNRKARRTEQTLTRIRLTAANLDEFSRILRQLESIANKELAGQDQSVGDAVFLKTLYRRLMYLSFNRSGTNTAPISMAVITDVAHEWQSGQSWEVGVGRPWLLFVAVPWRGDRYVCKGAIYSYSELTRPVTGRLTDPVWREMTGREMTGRKKTEGPRPWLADTPLAGPPGVQVPRRE